MPSLLSDMPRLLSSRVPLDPLWQVPLVCRTGCRQPGISCFCSLQSPPPFLPGCLLPSLRAQLGIPFLRSLHIPGGGGMPPQSPSSWQSGYTIHTGGLRPAGASGPIELCLPRWTALAAQGKSHLRLFFFSLLVPMSCYFSLFLTSAFGVTLSKNYHSPIQKSIK